MMSYLVFFSWLLLLRNQMIFLVQCGINKHMLIFLRPQIALALRARAILLSLKNLLVLINTKLHSKSCYYKY